MIRNLIVLKKDLFYTIKVQEVVHTNIFVKHYLSVCIHINCVPILMLFSLVAGKPLSLLTFSSSSYETR